MFTVAWVASCTFWTEWCFPIGQRLLLRVLVVCLRVLFSEGRQWGRHKWGWSKTQKRLAIVQVWEGSVRGRPWPGDNTFRAVTFPSVKLPVAQSAIFECFWCAQTTYVVCAHAGAQSFFFASRHARLRRASATGHSAARPGQAAPTSDSDSKSNQVQSTNLLLPARLGLPPTARCLSSGFAWTRTAELL